MIVSFASWDQPIVDRLTIRVRAGLDRLHEQGPPCWWEPIFAPDVDMSRPGANVVAQVFGTWDAGVSVLGVAGETEAYGFCIPDCTTLQEELSHTCAVHGDPDEAFWVIGTAHCRWGRTRQQDILTDLWRNALQELQHQQRRATT